MPPLFSPVVKFVSYSGVEVSHVFGVSKFFSIERERCVNMNPRAEVIYSM